jgi:hypothetical protein
MDTSSSSNGLPPGKDGLGVDNMLHNPKQQKLITQSDDQNKHVT